MLFRSITRCVVHPELCNPFGEPDRVPGERALLVLMENGGFETLLPDELGFDYATCGDFEIEIAPGDDLGDLIAEVIDTIATDIGCLDPANWQHHHVDLRQHVLDVTDTALEDLGFGIVTSGVGLANVVNTLTTAHPVYDRDRKSTRLNSSHIQKSRMPSSA